MIDAIQDEQNNTVIYTQAVRMTGAETDVYFMVAQLVSARMWVKPLRNAAAKISSCDIRMQYKVRCKGFLHCCKGPSCTIQVTPLPPREPPPCTDLGPDAYQIEPQKSAVLKLLVLDSTTRVPVGVHPILFRGRWRFEIATVSGRSQDKHLGFFWSRQVLG